MAVQWRIGELRDGWLTLTLEDGTEISIELERADGSVMIFWEGTPPEEGSAGEEQPTPAFSPRRAMIVRCSQ